jgi:hypothetical protein
MNIIRIFFLGLLKKAGGMGRNLVQLTMSMICLLLPFKTTIAAHNVI